MKKMTAAELLATNRFRFSGEPTVYVAERVHTSGMTAIVYKVEGTRYSGETIVPNLTTVEVL